MAPAFLPTILLARALSSTADIECPKPRANEIGTGKPLFGNGTINLHQFMVYVSAPCLLVTLLACWFLVWRHLHRYTSPQEQRQIPRIINLPVAYCLFNFLALTFTLDYLYIEPISDVYEAFTVAALFFLILEYVCPDGTDREKYFDNLELHGKKGRVLPGGSLKWFQKTYSQALQYPLMKTILIIIQIVTQYFGDYCESSFSPKHAHLWLTLADYIFVGGALGATIKFFFRVQKECAPVHKGRAKIFSFIGILIFQLIQGLIFHLLNGKLFSPTATATYNDINFGIASFMTCIEAVVFSFIFHWSFSSGEYKEGQRVDRFGTAPAQRTKTFKAIFDALNPSDIISGTVVALQLLFVRVHSRYGGRNVPMRESGYGADDGVHLEPLTERRNVRGYDSGIPADNEDETHYTPGYSAPPSAPPMPPSARYHSPGTPYDGAQRFGADDLRPDSYSRAGHSRSNSQENMPLQQTRSYV